MSSMIDKAKQIGYNVGNLRSEDKLSQVYKDVSKQILRLSNSPRAEQFTWSIHAKNLKIFQAKTARQFINTG